MALTQQEIQVLLKMRSEGQQSIDLFSGALNRAGAAGDSASSGVDRASGSIDRSGVAATAAGVAMGEFAVSVGAKVVELGKDTVLTAARTEGLTAVAEFLGQKTGKTKQQVDDLIGSIKGQGVTTQEASNLVVQLSRSNLGLENATKLATVAQNGAFIANESTAEAIGQLITGIVTLQPELIRSAGVTVSLQQAEIAYAKQKGITVEQISAHQKQELLLQAVLKEGENINGVYGLSMQYVGKQLTSLPRYIEEAKNAIGQQLLPQLRFGVTAFTDLLKIIQSMPGPFVDLGIAVAGVVTPFVLLKGASSIAGMLGDIRGGVAGLTLEAIKLPPPLREGHDALKKIYDVNGKLVAGESIFIAGNQAEVAAGKMRLLQQAVMAVFLIPAAFEFGKSIGGFIEKSSEAIDASSKLGHAITSPIRGFQDWVETMATAANGTASLFEQQRAMATAMALSGERVTSYARALEILHAVSGNVNAAQARMDSILASLLPKPLALAAGFDLATKSSTGYGNVLELLDKRSRDYNDALQILGVDGLKLVHDAVIDGRLKAKDLEEQYGFTTDAAHRLEKQFKDEAEAAKKAAEEHKKLEKAVADATGSAIKLSAADAIVAVTLHEQGVTEEEIARLIGARVSQVKNAIKADEEDTKMIELRRSIEKKAIEESNKEYQQWGVAVSQAADRAAAAILHDLDLEIRARAELEDLIAQRTLTTTDYQIFQIRREEKAMIDSLKTRGELSRQAYDEIEAIAAEKIAAIERANDPLWKAWQGLNVDMRQEWADTWTQALTTHEGFVDALLSRGSRWSRPG
jgi:hypothetical protein